MWRKPTEDDLAATLSQRELDAYRRSGSAGGAEPVEDLLARTAQMVRGYCRANHGVVMCRTEGTIPESLVSPAMDYAAYDVLKRLPAPVIEDRRRARDEAQKLFERVANGDFTPEAGEGGDPDAGRFAGPVFNRPPRRIL